MKIAELINKLSKYDPNDVVILSKDSEGNSHSPLSDIEEYLYVPESAWNGDIYYRNLTKRQRAAGYTDEDLYHGDRGQNCVVLWPNN